MGPRIRLGGDATPSPSQLISPSPCTGLGLSIVCEIVQGIGGSVTAENRAERGAVLNLSLPLAKHSIFQPATEARQNRSRTAGSSTIAVARP